MTTYQLTNRLDNLLVEMGFNREAFTDKARFNHDLGLDSLDVADLFIHVEDGFGVRIPDEDWDKIQTVGELKNYLITEFHFN